MRARARVCLRARARVCVCVCVSLDHWCRYPDVVLCCILLLVTTLTLWRLCSQQRKGSLWHVRTYSSLERRPQAVPWHSVCSIWYFSPTCRIRFRMSWISSWDETKDRLLQTGTGLSVRGSPSYSKSKVAPVTKNYVIRMWRQYSTRYNFRHWMMLSGQTLAPSTLLKAKHDW